VTILHAVKIVRQKRPGQGADSFLLRVPRQIAEAVPNDARFVAEAVDDGILFRVVRDETPQRPAWLAEG